MKNILFVVILICFSQTKSYSQQGKIVNDTLFYGMERFEVGSIVFLKSGSAKDGLFAYIKSGGAPVSALYSKSDFLIKKVAKIEGRYIITGVCFARDKAKGSPVKEITADIDVALALGAKEL